MDTDKTVTINLAAATYAAAINSSIEHCTVDEPVKQGAYNSQVVFNFTPDEGYQITGYRCISNRTLNVYNSTIVETGNDHLTTYKYGADDASPDVTMKVLDRGSDAITRYEVEVKSTVYYNEGLRANLVNFVANTVTIRDKEIIDCYIRAKLPLHTHLIPPVNGNVSVYWLTDNVGTGEYEVYKYRVVAGDNSGVLKTEGYWIIVVDQGIEVGGEVTAYIDSVSPQIQANQDVSRVEENYDETISEQSGNILTLTLDRNYCIIPVVEVISTE